MCGEAAQASGPKVLWLHVGPSLLFCFDSKIAELTINIALLYWKWVLIVTSALCVPPFSKVINTLAPACMTVLMYWCKIQSGNMSRDRVMVQNNQTVARSTPQLSLAMHPSAKLRIDSYHLSYLPDQRRRGTTSSSLVPRPLADKRPPS